MKYANIKYIANMLISLSNDVHSNSIFFYIQNKYMTMIEIDILKIYVLYKYLNFNLIKLIDNQYFI